MYIKDVEIHVTRPHLGLLLSHSGDRKKGDPGNKVVASLTVSLCFFPPFNLLQPGGRFYWFLHGFLFSILSLIVVIYLN